MAVVPGDAKVAASRNQSNTSAAVSDKFVLHSRSTKDLIAVAGEGRSNNLRILSKTTNSEFCDVASRPENGFCAYSGSRGVVEVRGDIRFFFQTISNEFVSILCSPILSFLIAAGAS